jgi:hypothetical protein
MRTQARSRLHTMYRSAFAMLALAVACTTGASCGSDGDSGGPADAFLGRWIKSFDEPIAGEPDATGFTISCTDPNFTFFTGSLLVWNSIAFEHGVVTDLVESSGNCPLLNWDIDSSGKAATVPNPDPVIDEVPECILELEYEDTAGNILPALMWIHPGADLKFSLLGTKNSIGAPKAQLQGSAQVDMARLDATNMRFDTAVATPCTYAGTDTYFRFTQP